MANPKTPETKTSIIKELNEIFGLVSKQSTHSPLKTV